MHKRNERWHFFPTNGKRHSPLFKKYLLLYSEWAFDSTGYFQFAFQSSAEQTCTTIISFREWASQRCSRRGCLFFWSHRIDETNRLVYAVMDQYLSVISW